MAAYGREWSHRHGSHERPGPRGQEHSGYGREFHGEGPRRRAPRRSAPYGREPGFEEEFGYSADVGYGMEMEYGPEEEFGAGRRSMTRRGYGAGRGVGTQRGYGMQRGYGAQRGYRTQRGYQAEPEFETERGYTGGEYGFWSDYGERQLPDYGYDFEFGGRAFPYRRSYRGAGPYGFQRAWGRAPLPRGSSGEQELPYGREFTRHGRRGGEPRYGHTPVDRWPQTGHDLDHLDREELEMSDGEVRDIVLENLFQDSWVNPERIDVDVDGGVVTLRGEVRDFMEARYAWDDAWESPGVRGVINNLTVRADLPQESMEMPQTSGGSQGTGGGRRR